MMRAVTAIFRELLGLFIEDGSLAAAALLWTALSAWGLPRLGASPQTVAALLALGLAGILAENALRAGRRK